MRSEIEPPMLIIKGIDAKTVDALGWRPIRVHFTDAAGVTHESHAKLMDVTMRKLDEEDILAPKPWLAVIKQLRKAKQVMAMVEDPVVISSAMVQ